MEQIASEPSGYLQTHSENPGKWRKLFCLVAQDLQPVLVKRASEQIDLIHINYDNFVASVDGIKKYDEVFSDEIGDLSGTVHLQVDENVTPIVLSARRLPVQYTSKIRKVGTVLFNDALNTFYLP